MINRKDRYVPHVLVLNGRLIKHEPVFSINRANQFTTYNHYQKYFFSTLATSYDHYSHAIAKLH